MELSKDLNLVETEAGYVKVLPGAENVLAVFITWDECTMRGGCGNHRKPFDITFHHNREDAESKLVDLAQNQSDYIHCPMVDEDNIDPNKLEKDGELIWEEGENSVDTGDNTVHIETVSDLFEYYNVRSRSERGMGGLLEQDIEDLVRLDCVEIVDEE